MSHVKTRRRSGTNLAQELHLHSQKRLGVNGLGRTEEMLRSTSTEHLHMGTPYSVPIDEMSILVAPN